jgi:hypothetical protein
MTNKQKFQLEKEKLILDRSKKRHSLKLSCSHQCDLADLINTWENMADHSCKCNMGIMVLTFAKISMSSILI